MMKGIILAGGSGSRLYPITRAVSKQLMPIYDKPMIYYPLSVLIKANIKEVLIITTDQDRHLFEYLLGDGSHLGCVFSYAIQEQPKGLAEAFIIGEQFIGKDDVCLILGDNVFYGSHLSELLSHQGSIKGAVIYAYQVSNPTRYAVVDIDKAGNIRSIVEKPKKPSTDLAVPGIYFFDHRVSQFAQNVQPSQRGELEITSVIQTYLDLSELKVIKMNREMAWLDTGTFESLSDASEFVRVIEKRQGIKVGCIEEEAYRKGFISKEQLKKLAYQLEKSGYGKYLKTISEGGV